MSQNHETHLVGVPHMSRTASETRQICRAEAGIATALETIRELLKTKWKSSERAKTVQKCKTHLMGAKSRHPGPPVDGDELALMPSTIRTIECVNHGPESKIRLWTS